MCVCICVMSARQSNRIGVAFGMSFIAMLESCPLIMRETPKATGVQHRDERFGLARGLLNNACLGMHGLSRNVAPAFIAGIEASAGIPA